MAATGGLKAGLKLPEEPTRGKKGKGGGGGKGGSQLLPKLPKGEVYTRLESRDLKLLLGPKPAYPLLLDFSSPDFQLETADFLLNAPNVFKELDFTSNSLVDCSNSFEHLNKLKRLIIDRNALCDIQFKGLVSLVTLSLADNRLNYLNDMGDLRKLVNLNLSGNKLTAGFDQIAKCKALRVLDLGSNNIDFALPQFWRSFRFLNTLPKLNWLSFEGNPCETTISHFREFLIHELPKLGYLNWKPVTREERAEASKLAAKGLWKDKDSFAELRKIKTASVMLRMGSSGSTIRPISVADRPPHTTTVPSTGKGKMLEELINGLDEEEEDNSLTEGERMSRSDTLSGVVGEQSGEIIISESKRTNAQLDNILEFLDEGETTASQASQPTTPGDDSGNGDALAGMQTLLASVPSPSVEKRQSGSPAVTSPKTGEENYLEMFYSMLNTPRKEDSSPSVPTRLVQTGGTLRRLEERTQIPSIKADVQDDVIFNMLDQIIEDKSAVPVNKLTLPVPNVRTSVRKSQIQDFADIENTLNELETKFADEEKQRQDKIEIEQEKLKKLEAERVQLLHQRERENRLTIQRQRDEHALRLEQERRRYEEEIKQLQEQQRQAQEEAEKWRKEMEEQKRLRILAEQQRSTEKGAAEDHNEEKRKDDTLLTNLQPFYCRYSELQIGQKLGLGAVGVTHRGILRSQLVAIKKYHCPTFSEALIKNLKDEAPKLSLLKHANLTEFVALCVDTEICSVSEWIDGANLYGYLRNPGNPTSNPEWILKVAQQVARAMEYLHMNGVIHGSLKSKNILLDRHGEIKVVDYGLLPAKRLALSASSSLPSANSGNCYMAPEVLSGDYPSFASDVYSYGILLWELFTREQPFSSLLPHQIADSVVHNQRPAVPICPFVFAKLMQSCWHGTSTSRPTFQIIARILSQSQKDLLRYEPTATARRGTAPVPVVRTNTQNSRELVTEKLNAVIERITDMLNSSNPQFKLKAVRAINEFAGEERNREAIVQSEALPSLLQLCADADDVMKEQALRSLSTIAQDDYTVSKIADKGGLRVLAVALEHEANPAVVLPALRSLVCLSRTLENKERIGELGIIVSLVRLLAHQNDLLQMQALIALGTLLTYEGNQIHYYKAGGVQPLLQLLASSNPGIQLRVLEVLAVLTNNEKMELIIKKVGVLRKLAPLIQSKSPLLKLQALQSVSKFSSRLSLRAEMESAGVVEALVNVFADPMWSDNREVLLHAASAIAYFVLDSHTEFTPGRLTHMVPFLVTGFADVKVELAKCFARILKKSGARRQEFLSLQGLPRLFQALASDATNDELQLHGLSALHALAKDGTGEILDAIGKAGIIEHMSEDTLTSNDEEVQRCSLQLFTVLSTNRELKNRFASSDAVAHLVPFLESTHNDMYESALLILANISDDEQCRRVIKEEEGLYPLLLSLERVSDGLLERVIWALSYFAIEDTNQKEMIEVGLSAIVRQVSHPKLAVQSLALKTLLLLIKNPGNRRAIELAGGREKLHGLTTSPNPTVAAAAAKALQLLQPSA